ncbi:MAG: class D beta-lactamase [Candidatus Delongbacteria bacterium]
MKHLLLLLLLLLGGCALGLRAAEPWTPELRPDWLALFRAAGVTGTLVMQELESGHWLASDTVRARERRLPASTFKIPNSLIALETGVLRDERQVLPWDGVTHPIAGWNRDHTLRSALSVSSVPVYQDFARRIGESRLRLWLDSLDYGNADCGGGVDHFWLDGALAISPVEQVRFLARLARLELPLSERSQRILREALIVEATPDYVLHAKTGWAARIEPGHGWWVGWLEREGRTLVFALNLDLRGEADLPLRQELVRRALAGLGELPPPGR